MNWSREQKADLARYWSEGHSAGQIVKLFEGRYTRNAIIGKVHALQLPSRKSKMRAAVKRHNRARKTEHRVAWNKGLKVSQARARVFPKQRTEAMPVEEPMSLNLTCEDLQPNQCKWPHGDGPFLFCGHPVKAFDKPYCEFHMQRAYQPWEPRRKPSTFNYLLAAA